MAQFSDAVLAGYYCVECMRVIDDTEPDYPRTCPACLAAAQAAKVRRATERHKRQSQGHKPRSAKQGGPTS
jgi:hypothetical protein